MFLERQNKLTRRCKMNPIIKFSSFCVKKPYTNKLQACTIYSIIVLDVKTIFSLTKCLKKKKMMVCDLALTSPHLVIGPTINNFQERSSSTRDSVCLSVGL